MKRAPEPECPLPKVETPEPDTQSTIDEPGCWICLDAGGDLIQACSCPRKVHAACMARWQLQKVGQSEEKACRFCGDRLPEWQPLMVPHGMVPTDDVVIAVVFNDEQHNIKVKPGPEGRRDFEKAIQAIFPAEEGDIIEFLFTCRHPLTQKLMNLEGQDMYDAAYHCAAVAATRRLG